MICFWKFQAFGVGALEDEDEDVYSVDHMSNYDVTMETEDPSNTYGWTAPGRKQGKITNYRIYDLYLALVISIWLH